MKCMWKAKVNWDSLKMRRLANATENGPPKQWEYAIKCGLQNRNRKLSSFTQSAQNEK